MAANYTDPKNLSDAIDRLERATHNKSQEIKDILGKDYSDLRKALDELKPHLDAISGKVTEKVQTTKTDVESKIHENPWTTLAVAGLVGLIFGWFFGFNSRRGE